MSTVRITSEGVVVDFSHDFLLHTGTPITQAEAANFVFAVGDFNRDGIPDVYGLKRTNAQTNTLEVHILNMATGTTLLVP